MLSTILRIGLLSFATLASQTAYTADSLSAQIRWTSYGVPHIQAADERGIGFGIGYAYARDNACLLAEEVLTARGERSRYFGQDGHNSEGVANLPSDLFYAWINRDEEVRVFDLSQPRTISDRLDGYVAGFNRYLREAGGSLPCAREPWLLPIKRDDLVRLTRRLLVERGLGLFIEPLSAAATAKTNKDSVSVTSELRTGRQSLRLELGSNAVAVGDARALGARSLLLANPHFSWSGALRFYQLHLTIPGQLDVMGAALPGLPLVNIGFNHHLAWTHTVDTSAHFSLYRLTLDPGRPRHYLIEGRSVPLRSDRVEVEVKEPAGNLRKVSEEIWSSEFGPLVRIPGKLDGSEQYAWAVRDANLNNSRILAQWDAINRANSTVALEHALNSVQGIPWVNTLAADDSGRVIYLNQSVVPYLEDSQLQSCALPGVLVQGQPGLRGDLDSCQWRTDIRAAQPGIVPADLLPRLAVRDVVQNSNNSAWFTNPAYPLTGFSPLVSRSNEQLGARTRYGLTRLAKANKIDGDFLQNMVTANWVESADWVLPDLLTFCDNRKQESALHAACSELAQWDQTANLDAGPGLQVFTGFMQRFIKNGTLWKHRFDPSAPLSTPRGIDLDNPASEPLLTGWLTEAVNQYTAKTWGEVQISGSGGTAVPIPGADGLFGVYNGIQSVPEGLHRQVVSGSSYIQLVRFTDNGPRVSGLLTFSQSTNPLSPHFRDQTRLFSAQKWPVLPFTERQIQADPELETLNINQ